MAAKAVGTEMRLRQWMKGVFLLESLQNLLPIARRGGSLHLRHFSARVTFLPVSYCVITSSREVFIKKLEPLADTRQPPLFCAKLDTSAQLRSNCIHVRKSKSSISLECLHSMYITQH